MSDPLVSVIIPTYQDADYLVGAIESVEAQTFDNVELVVIDSGGAEWAEDVADVYEFQEPNGPAAARNRGIELASGDLIAFLDADDRWHPKKLTRQVDVLERTDADLVWSDQEVTSA